MNEWCLVYEWVISHIWMRRIAKWTPLRIAKWMSNFILFDFVWMSKVWPRWMSTSHHVTWCVCVCVCVTWGVCVCVCVCVCDLRCVCVYVWLNPVIILHRSHVTYEWVTSRIRLSHVTQMYESRYTYKRVISHITESWCHVWMSHVTHMDASYHTYEWVMSHIWMSHVTHMNESCRKYGWVMSHIWMCHVTHMNESCHTNEWVISHLNKSWCHWCINRFACEWVISHMYESFHIWSSGFVRTCVCLCGVQMRVCVYVCVCVWMRTFVCVYVCACVFVDSHG